MRIANCKCGRKAAIGDFGKYVICTRLDDCRENVCWTGPERKTEKEAIKSWNKVMGGKK